MNNVSVSRLTKAVADAIEHERIQIVTADIYRKALEEVIADALEQALAQPFEQPAISFPMLPTNAEAEAEADRLFGERRKQVAKPLIEQPAKAEQPAEQVSYDICSHGIVGGCLRDDPEPAKEQPGDVGRDDSMRDCPACHASGEGEKLDMIPYAPLNQWGETTSDYSGRCCKCWMIGPRKKTREEALAVWNALPRATLSPSVPAEAVAWTLIDEDGEAQDIEFDETKARERAADYGWTVAPLYLAPPANDEAVRLRSALQKIKTEEGKVCENFELCTHRACQSSYGAWAIADEALASQQEEKGA